MDVPMLPTTNKTSEISRERLRPIVSQRRPSSTAPNNQPQKKEDARIAAAPVSICRSLRRSGRDILTSIAATITSAFRGMEISNSTTW
mmetsp:Transcript_25616/g.31442  ORF Transcript_25616/g.31442 Transcript_25616/m.31442 type:complete len:88 (-) Transcript_25616:130-393(-)